MARFQRSRPSSGSSSGGISAFLPRSARPISVSRLQRDPVFIGPLGLDTVTSHSSCSAGPRRSRADPSLSFEVRHNRRVTGAVLTDTAINRTGALVVSALRHLMMPV